MVHVVNSANSNAGKLFMASVDKACASGAGDMERVAFDCEGVKLSRSGSLELICICFSQNSDVFLIDTGGKAPDLEVVRAVKQLFEHRDVVKIIHDCRMDSDALFHIHGIKLENVHDTSCFHDELSGCEDSKNLNHVLNHNGLGQNNHRDVDEYRTNKAFWGTRPLTQKMIDWASSDVSGLMQLATRQLARIGISTKARALAKSQKYASFGQDMKLASGLTVNNTGKFIGRRGANIKMLKRITNTLIREDGETWRVYYTDSNALATVKRSMNNY